MSQNKTANIPVASHGLHKHKYNYPWLGSLNFCEVLPCYVNTLRAGERDEPCAGLYSQLMPILHNAFITGRYNFKAIYVPFFRVWRPWTAFAEQTEFKFDSNTFAVPENYPYVHSGSLNTAFCDISNGYVTEVTQSDQYDIIFGNVATSSRYLVVTEKGQRVLKILMALGITPNWVKDDNHRLNILLAMCYIKAFADYYFPNQYVGDSHYNKLAVFFNTVTIGFDAVKLLEALDICSLGFYDNSVFENMWDNPIAPNVRSSVPSDVYITDPTNNASGGVLGVFTGVAPEPIQASQKPRNGTPFVGGTQANGNYSVTGVLTQYVVDALKSVSMWMKRKQLAGARLIDRFLVSRGIPLQTAENDMSYFMGQRNVEIDVKGVENNSDTNLGELAGRGLASSGDEPLSFKVRADYDGAFFVIVHAVPDASFPVAVDGFTMRQDYLDNYTAEFDKLGPVDVPVRAVGQTFIGPNNEYHLNRVFGFAQAYWDEVQERPRLLGDFVLNTRGARELAAYHSFREINQLLAVDMGHSYAFIRQADYLQYSRFFYSDKQNNLMLFLRWFGQQYKEKLPLGDSYEWDDDEFNRKVNLVVNGSEN